MFRLIKRRFNQQISSNGSHQAVETKLLPAATNAIPTPRFDVAGSTMAQTSPAMEVKALPAASTTTTVPRAPATALVERDQEFDRLKRYWQAAIEGHGKIVLLSGEAGNGKSSLADVFIKSVQAEGTPHKIARAACSAQSGRDEPFWPFADAIGQLAQTSKVSVADNIIDAVLDIAPSWAAVIPVAGTVIGASAKTVQVVRTRTRSELPGPDKLLREYVSALKKVTEKQPVLMFIDDLHWGDAASIRLLSHLSRNINALRVLIIVAYRPSDLAVEGHPLHELINELLRYDTDTELALPPLTAEGAQALINRLYPANKFAPSLASTLHASTGGSPFFIVESLRLMLSRGQIAQDTQDGKWALLREINDEDLPRNVEAVVRKRMERMPRELQEALALAAVQGVTFETAVLAHVLGQDELAVMRLLEPAEKLHDIIDYVGDVELDQDITSRFRFTSSIIQRELLGTLRGKQLLIAQRKTAEGIEQLWGNDSDDLAPKLATHYEKGKLWDKAAHYTIIAAKQARAAGAVAQAITLFESAERLLARCGATSPAQQFEIDEGLSYLYEIDSSYDKAEIRTRRALSGGSDALGWRRYAALQIRLAKLADNAGHFTESLQILQHVQDLLSSANQDDWHSPQAYQLRAEMAQALTHVSRADEGIKCAEEALALLAQRPADEESNRLRIYLMAAMSEAHAAQGNYKQVISILQDTCVQARKLGLFDILSESLGSLALTQLMLGQYDLARAVIRDMIDTAQQISSESLMAAAYLVAGRALIYQAKPFAALRQLDEAERFITQSKYFAARPQLLSLRSVALIHLGRTDEAQPILDEARTIAQASGSREWTAYVDLFQGMYALAKRDGLKALPLVQHAVQVFTEEGARFSQAYALREMGQVYRELGQLRLAKKAFDDAQAIFATIGNQHQVDVTAEEAGR
ncbi:MAG: AAA family ATPase [Chloroflexi bacterium]|nr:AAA family ATPase [Chloroflexota bacterium]